MRSPKASSWLIPVVLRRGRDHLGRANCHRFPWGPRRVPRWGWVELIREIRFPLESAIEVKWPVIHWRVL